MLISSLILKSLENPNGIFTYSSIGEEFIFKIGSTKIIKPVLVFLAKKV
jgi:hypothetical protein